MNDPMTKLESFFSDPYRRMNGLYNIVDKKGNKLPFRFNWAQEELYRNMWYCNVILKARQLGISTFICLLFLDRCLFNSNIAAGIICHTREDAEHLFKRIKFAYDSLPEELKTLRPATIDSARELRFNNGSFLRVGTSMRGSTLQYLHISEFGKICAKYPDKAREIVSGSLNTVAPGQFIFIESTAEGREGHFYEICKKAQALKDSKTPLTKLDFKFFFFPWWRCPEYYLKDPILIKPELSEYFQTLQDSKIHLSSDQMHWYASKYLSQGEDMLREYPSTPEEAFQATADGLYYGRYLTKARTEGRIGHVYHDPNLPTFASMDLGFNDSTAIWWFQVAGQEIRLIDYYERSGEPLTHYLKILKDKPYSLSKIFVPHDAAATEYGSGLTRMQIARNHGIELTLTPKLEISEGIDAVRNILDRCWFDEEKCSQGIKSLENYKKEWDDRHGYWKNRPVHNFASDGADAFRYLAINLENTKTGMTAEDAKRMHNQALYENRGGLAAEHPLFSTGGPF